MYGIAATLAPRFDEPLELLEACHARIETQLAMLERLVTHVAQHGCDLGAREAARFIMRYFDTAGVQHHRDENEDLFPLLRTKAGEVERPEVSAGINEAGRDHEKPRVRCVGGGAPPPPRTRSEGAVFGP